MQIFDEKEIILKKYILIVRSISIAKNTVSKQLVAANISWVAPKQKSHDLNTSFFPSLVRDPAMKKVTVLSYYSRRFT